MNEEDLLETGVAEYTHMLGDHFRQRSRSAPPALWAAKKYGQQLRRMSDEFDKGVRKAIIWCHIKSRGRFELSKEYAQVPLKQ